MARGRPPAGGDALEGPRRADHLQRRLHAALAGLGIWALRTRDDGRFVGCVHLRPWAPAEDTLDLGYRLRRAEWGRGFASEASRALLARAFSDGRIARVIANTLEANAASRAVLERLGTRLVERFEYTEERLPGWLPEECPAVRYAIDRAGWSPGSARSV